MFGVLIGNPFLKAPLPHWACHNSLVIGLYTIPARTCFLIANPTHIAIMGIRWTKFVVPSIGSIIHVGASLHSALIPAALLSSPINLWSGKVVDKFEINNFSTAWSVSVTKSVFDAFVETEENGWSNALRTS